MKKLALFVEGQTEQIFVERLLLEMAGRRGLKIDSYSASGGRKPGSRKLTTLRVAGETSDVHYYVMLVDCGNDSRVRSDIGERYDSLVAAGYSSIIGIRDVFPLVFNEIARLRAGLFGGLKSDPIQVAFVLGVMEIESWFLAEYSHLERLSVALVPSTINAALGFDPQCDDLQVRPHPAVDLDNVYKLARFRYRKKRSHVERTVNLLDYARIYIETRGRFADLDCLITNLDAFLDF